MTCRNFLVKTKGKFPEKWKTSVIALLNNEGDKAAIMFYRPIKCYYL